MGINEKYLNKTRKEVLVPAYSTVTVEYNDSMPNYYRVTNMGESRLYCATSFMPTVKRHEFTVAPNKIKLYAEPSRRNNLYIYNPSGSDVECVIFSFEAVFDPATLALADLEIDLSGKTMDTRSIVSGFETELPTGKNKIGKVEIEGDNVASILAAVNGAATEATLAAVKTALEEVKTAVNSGATQYYETPTTASYIDKAEEVDFSHAQTTKLCVHFLTNDGSTSIMVRMYDTRNFYSTKFELKPGETITDWNLNTKKLIVGPFNSGEACSFRIVHSWIM